MTNIAMPSLNLQLRWPGDDACDDEIFPIAKYAVESGDEDIIQAAARDIALKLIEYKPPPGRVDFRASFDPVCLEMAEQVPYDSERMLDVLRLLELVHTSPKLVPELTGEDQQREVFGYKDLSMTLWDSWNHYILSPPREEDDFPRCVNWHAFVSRLFQSGLVIGSSAPVGFLNEVLANGRPHLHNKEDRSEDRLRKFETRTMAASQYLLRWGDGLLKHLLTTYNPSSPAFDHGSYGWAGCNAQGIEIWHIWRKSLSKIAAGGKDEGGKTVSTKAKEFFAEIVKLMDKIEAEGVSQTE